MLNWLVDALNYLIAGLGWVLTALLGILPASPIQAIDNSPVSQYLGYVNWFIPVSDMVVELGLFCTAVLIYYAIGIVMRWGKVIE